MKTYVTVTFSSEGAPASKVVELLSSMGFETALGNHDFVYDWKKRDTAPAEVINLLDRVQSHLAGTKVHITFITIP